MPADPPAPPPVRAFHRGYATSTGRRAGQVRRLHIMREDGKWAGKQGECGTTGWNVRDSDTVLHDPMPATPPAGLTWCPPCVGRLAERLGALDLFAAELAGVAVRLHEDTAGTAAGQ